jgi:hypothetical protein
MYSRAALTRQSRCVDQMSYLCSGGSTPSASFEERADGNDDDGVTGR